MSGEFGDGGGGFEGGGGEGAGASEAYAGYSGNGDRLPASTSPAAGSRLPPGNGGQRPAPSRHDAPPQSWAQEHHPHWQAVPEQLRGYIHQRESEATKRISELGQTASAHKEIAGAFERYGMHQMPAGLTHAKVIEGLLAAGQALKTNPGAVIAHLAKANGVDLAQLIGFGGNAPKMLETLGRRAEQAEQQVAALRAELARRDALGRDAEQKRRSENARQVAEAKRQNALNQHSGRGGVPAKGTLRDSLQRHADRLYGR